MSMSLISSVTVGSGGAASIEFTSIPQDGTDLLVLISGRNSNPFASADINITLNGVTTSTYVFNRIRGTGSAVAASSGTTTFWGQQASVGDAATANTFSNTSLYISNYTSSSNKSALVESVNETNATAALAFLTAYSWSNTAAITTINLASNSSNFLQHSTASLYKITKGSDGIVTTS